MTKKEKIEEEYSKFFDGPLDLVDENGWCRLCNLTSPELVKAMMLNKDSFDSRVQKLPDAYNSSFRPKTLRGLETNNGWVMIGSDYDLPNDETIKYHTGWFENGKLTNYGVRDIIDLRNQVLQFNAVNCYIPIHNVEAPLYDTL